MAHITARELASPPFEDVYVRAFAGRVTSFPPPASVEYNYVGKQSIPTTGLSPASPAALWAADPDPDSFRPQNQRSRTQNPKQTRPQPPVGRGWADKADSRPPLRGPGGWGGDWYLWHAPECLRAIAATALRCMQAYAEKLGVIEASYTSAVRESRTRCVPFSSLQRPATHLRGQFALRGRCPGARPQLHGRTGVPDASTDTHGSRRLIVSYTDK